MKLLPFDFADTCRYFKKFSGEDKAVIYGMVGGTPQYLLQMNDRISVEENIKYTFLNPTSALFEEPENLLKQEVREPALYNAIITAIAAGASRMAEIATKVGEETSVCAAYLKNLIALGLIQKETPYGIKTSRKSIYTIDDNMFRFWYRFVPGNSSIIARGAADLVYKRIEPYSLTIWEKFLKKYVSSISGNCYLSVKPLWNLKIWDAGGGRIPPPIARQKSTLWARKTRIPHCLENANGQMKILIRVF